ncbi:MAG TPA: hypothetical protein EYP74_00985 [Anaerolineales bacterium]|nr:hypothetical protein [Anaerolineales bacterium]
MPISSLIQIKGLRDGILISLGAGDWDYIQALLLTQIDERSAFFTGAKLAIDVGTHALRVAELSRLRAQLSERDISLWAVVSESPKTVNTAQLLGLATRISKQRPNEMPPKKVKEVDVGKDDSALWVQKTLRSGARIEYAGNIVVMGDVNPGAEIVAGGNILVWGRLRGSVYAGADVDGQNPAQNAEAFVCALTMTPSRLQIAGEIRNPVEDQKSKKAVKIFYKDDKFHVKTW